MADQTGEAYKLQHSQRPVARFIGRPRNRGVGKRWEKVVGPREGFALSFAPKRKMLAMSMLVHKPKTPLGGVLPEYSA